MPKLAAAAAAAAPEVRAAAAAAPDTIDHARPNGRFSDWVKTAEAWPNPFSANTLEEDKPFKHMPKKCKHAQGHLMQMYTEFGTRALCEPCYKTMHGGWYTPSRHVAQTSKCDACFIPDRELVRRLFKGAPPNTAKGGTPSLRKRQTRTGTVAAVAYVKSVLNVLGLYFSC